MPTKKEIDEAIEIYKRDPKYASPEKQAKLEARRLELYQQNEPKRALDNEKAGVGWKALDGITRAMDYAGGLSRTGLAQLVDAVTSRDIVNSKDWDNALRGAAPSTDQFLERGGVGEGGSLSDLLPSMYSEDGKGLALQKGGMFDPTARGAAGLVGDMVTDPGFWVTLGGNQLAKRGLKGTAEFVTNPLGKIATSQLKNRGVQMYKSAPTMKHFDAVADKFGKEPVSDLMMREGIWGGAHSIDDQARSLGKRLADAREEILRKADDYVAQTGDGVNVENALKYADERAAKLKKYVGLTDDEGKALSRTIKKVDDYLIPKPAEGPAIPKAPPPRNTGILDEMGRPIMVQPPTPPMRLPPATPPPRIVNATEGSAWKSLANQKAGDAAFDRLRDSTGYKDGLAQLARGFKEEVENLASRAEPGMGGKLAQTNDELGRLLTIDKALHSEGRKEANKNFWTSVDAIVATGGLLGPGQHFTPVPFAVKKLTDISKGNRFRTGGGLGLNKAGRVTEGVTGDAIRRLLIEQNQGY